MILKELRESFKTLDQIVTEILHFTFYTCLLHKNEILGHSLYFFQKHHI